MKDKDHEEKGQELLTEHYKKKVSPKSLVWITIMLLIILGGVSLLFYWTGLWQFFTDKERKGVAGAFASFQYFLPHLKTSIIASCSSL